MSNSAQEEVARFEEWLRSSGYAKADVVLRAVARWRGDVEARVATMMGRWIDVALAKAKGSYSVALESLHQAIMDGHQGEEIRPLVGLAILQLRGAIKPDDDVPNNTSDTAVVASGGFRGAHPGVMEGYEAVVSMDPDLSRWLCWLRAGALLNEEIVRNPKNVIGIYSIKGWWFTTASPALDANGTLWVAALASPEGTIWRSIRATDALYEAQLTAYRQAGAQVSPTAPRVTQAPAPRVQPQPEPPEWPSPEEEYLVQEYQDEEAMIGQVMRDQFEQNARTRWANKLTTLGLVCSSISFEYDGSTRTLTVTWGAGLDQARVKVALSRDEYDLTPGFHAAGEDWQDGEEIRGIYNDQLASMFMCGADYDRLIEPPRTIYVAPGMKQMTPWGRILGQLLSRPEVVEKLNTSQGAIIKSGEHEDLVIRWMRTVTPVTSNHAIGVFHLDGDNFLDNGLIVPVTGKVPLVSTTDVRVFLGRGFNLTGSLTTVTRPKPDNEFLTMWMTNLEEQGFLTAPVGFLSEPRHREQPGAQPDVLTVGMRVSGTNRRGVAILVAAPVGTVVENENGQWEKQEEADGPDHNVWWNPRTDLVASNDLGDMRVLSIGDGIEDDDQPDEPGSMTVGQHYSAARRKIDEARAAWEDDKEQDANVAMGEAKVLLENMQAAYPDHRDTEELWNDYNRLEGQLERAAEESRPQVMQQPRRQPETALQPVHQPQPPAAVSPADVPPADDPAMLAELRRRVRDVLIAEGA